MAGLVFATLSPIGMRPVSGTSVGLERFGAFALIGCLFAFGYRKHPVRLLALVILVAAGLEALQLIEATRHGRMTDLVVKVAGAGVGVAMGSVLAALNAVRQKVEARL